MTQTKRPFIKGLKLSELFYQEAVAPLLTQHFPELAYAAARLDGGSDVLGFDTEQSTDHDWGCRLQIFVREGDVHLAEAIVDMLSQHLPPSVHGYSTHFGVHEDGSTVVEAAPENGRIQHRVTVHTTESYCQKALNWQPNQLPTIANWLLMPQQELRCFTHGAVFHDAIDELTDARKTLAFYPDDLWRFLLAAQWDRIAEEEPFLGRTGQVGDDLGSRLLAGRLLQDVMRLCFLLERTYAPYAKWFGSAFAQLACASTLLPLFDAVWAASDWQARQTAMTAVYQTVAQMQNDTGLADPQPAKVSRFHERPFLIIHGDRFSSALREQITDPAVLSLHAWLGSVDQWIDATPWLSYPKRLKLLTSLYQH